MVRPNKCAGVHQIKRNKYYSSASVCPHHLPLLSLVFYLWRTAHPTSTQSFKDGCTHNTHTHTPGYMLLYVPILYTYIYIYMYTARCNINPASTWNDQEHINMQWSGAYICSWTFNFMIYAPDHCMYICSVFLSFIIQQLLSTQV